MLMIKHEADSGHRKGVGELEPAPCEFAKVEEASSRLILRPLIVRNGTAEWKTLWDNSRRPTDDNTPLLYRIEGCDVTVLQKTFDLTCLCDESAAMLAAREVQELVRKAWAEAKEYLSVNVGPGHGTPSVNGL